MMKQFAREIKLIAIDIDGTLLTPTHQITPRVKAAIQAAQQAGIVVTLATGRRYSTTGLIATELDIDLPLIVYDGALIANHPAATILHSQTLAITVVQQAVEIFQRHAIQPIIHPCDCLAEEVWTGPAELDHLELATYISLVEQEGRARRRPYATLCIDLEEPLRVVAFSSETAIQPMLPELASLDCSWHMIKQGSYGCAELTLLRTGCSKASAVAALASHYGIPLEQVMAVGDNTNDIAMLQSVGWGVAMGQAPATVKAVANAVTATNLEDGVALAIEHYALALPSR